MTFNKIGGKIFSVQLNKAEQKALEDEVEKQVHAVLDKRMKALQNEIDAITLLELANTLGFGEVRLRRFFENFRRDYNELIQRYEMYEDDEIEWLYTKKLLDKGIDIAKWNEEYDDEH